MSNLGKGNPFKSLYSYEEKDEKIFYGRDREIKELFRLVKLNMLTVVFGKSGIGKSSLLHAGVFPRLRKENFLPISIRLDYSPSAPLILKQITQKIQNELKHHHLHEMEKGKKEPTDTFQDGETLWEYFHRVDHFDPSGNRVTPVLLFDQFEEFFTIGKSHPEREALVDELYFLAEDQLPFSLREKFKKTGKVFPYINEHAVVRVVLGLRDNYLPQLNLLKQQIPPIDRIMFQVLHLNGMQAREIMEKVEGFGDEKTRKDVLRSFYPEGTPENLDIPDEKLEVEPFLLSLMCYRMFETGATSLSRQEKDELIANFYDEELSKLPHSEKLADFIETHLLTEGGFRTPFYLEPTDPLRVAVEVAVDRKILRKVNYGEREYVEIIHDVLIPVIKEKRNRRLDEKQRQEFQKKIQQRQKLYRIVGVAGIISLFLAIMFLLQKNRADRLYIEVVGNRLAVESSFVLPGDNIKAIRMAEAAYEIGLPKPSSLQQVLTTAAYSTFDRPFYSAKREYEDKVASIIDAPGGIKILTISMNGAAKVWDLDKGLIINLSQYTNKVSNGIFSPDGSKVITLSRDNAAKLWNLKGELLANLDKHTDRVWSAAFSPDGTKIVTTSDDKTAKLWDLNGMLLADLRIHRAFVSNAVFSPDSSKLLTASWDNTAKLWDLSGKLLADLRGHTDYVWSATFSHSGDRIITASSDNTVKVWDLKGKLLYDLKLPDRVWSAALSSDGKTVLARVGNTAKLCDLEGNLIADLKRHSADISDAFFSKAGDKILTCSGNTAGLWDVKGNLIADLGQHTDYVSKALFYNDDAGILTCSGNTVKSWDLEKNFVVDLNKSMGTVRNAVFSPDKTKIITWSGNIAKLFDLKNNHSVELKQHTAPILSVAFSPDNSKVLTGSWDNTAKLWDMKGNLLFDFKQHPAQVSAVAFMPGGGKILTVAQYNTAALWDLHGNLLAKFNINMDAVEKAILSPDGSRMLTWYDKGNIAMLWDMNGKILAELKKHSNYIISAAFSPKGDKILTGSNDKTAILWDLNGNPLSEMKKHTGPVTGAFLSPKGDRIITTSDDNTAKLWDLQGNLLADLNKNSTPVVTAAFIDNGKRILTVSKDGTIKRWYTPEAIMEALKTSAIPPLSKEDKENLGIADF